MSFWTASTDTSPLTFSSVKSHFLEAVPSDMFILGTVAFYLAKLSLSHLPGRDLMLWTSGTQNGSVNVRTGDSDNPVSSG